MNVVQLPPGTVWYLDALATGETDLQEPLQAFLSDCASARQWLHSESGYTLHEAEAAQLANIQYLWDQVDELLQNENGATLLESLFPLIIEAATLMEKVGKERDKGHFSPLPQVNRLVQAGAAYIQGRGQSEALQVRLVHFREFAEELRALYLDLKGRIPAEVQPDIEKGLALMDKGAEELQQALAEDDKERLRGALSDAHTGSGLLEYVLEWHKNSLSEQMKQFHRFHIPLVGPQLEAELIAARSAEPEQRQRIFQHTLSETLPALEDAWEQAYPAILMPSVRRAELFERTEACLEELYETYQAAVEGHEFDTIESKLEQTSKAFEEIAENALHGFRTSNSTVALYLDAIQGVLRGTVPLFTLQNMLTHDPPPGNAEVEKLFEEYWESGDESALCDVASELVALHPPLAETTENGYNCSFCGNFNEESLSRCLGCGAKLH